MCGTCSSAHWQRAVFPVIHSGAARACAADHVIIDEQKRRNYLRLFMLRCYMSQEPPLPGGALRPHYAFMVEKSKRASGGRTDRLIAIDLLEQKMQNFKKDTLHKEFHLSTLAGVQAGDKPLELSIQFKETHPYFIRTRCQEQYDTLFGVLERIVSAVATGALSDETLDVLCDDAESPPSSVQKSKVIKRADGSALMNDWQPRFMVMGSTQLLLFRDVDLQQLVNIIPLSLLRFTYDSRDRSCFQLATPYWKASFRVLTEEVAARWKSSLEQQRAWIEEHLRRDPSLNAARAHPAGLRPSVIFSEADLASMHTPAARGSPTLPAVASARAAVSRKLAAMGEDEPVPHSLMPPGFAAGDSEHESEHGTAHDSCRMQHTSSAEPAGAESIGADAEESATAREAQLKALREEGPAVPSEVAFSEAKGSMLAAMQGMERSLLKARRGVEVDKGLADLTPLLDTLRNAFDGLAAARATYEQSAMRRAETQRTFLQSKAAYLDGLQSHVLGEDAEDHGMAAKIFRKGAYVADTFCKLTNMRGVL